MIPQLGDDSQLHSQLGVDFATWFAARGQFRNHFAAHFAALKWVYGAAKWHSCAKGWFCSCETTYKMGARLRNCRSALCSCLQTAITSSFQLQFMHHLKRWTPDFLSFEMTYSMHEMDSKKYSKCVQQLLSSWILHVRFLSLLSLLAFMICFWKRITKLQSLDSSWKWASICFSMDYIKLSLILDCFGDKKAMKNTKT